MASPYRQIADALETIINAEYAPEGYKAIHDRLHPSVGREGTRIGISLDEERTAPGRGVQMNTAVLVQFYRRWDPDVDPTKKVDPRVIADFAERFRVAVRTHDFASSGSAWYFNLDAITYPNDPVGNKTRFEARLTAFGNNTALVETTG
jgi:hypothetical protein